MRRYRPHLKIIGSFSNRCYAGCGTRGALTFVHYSLNALSGVGIQFWLLSMLHKFTSPLAPIFGPSTALYIIITSSPSKTHLLYGLLLFIGWLFGARLVRLSLHYYFVRRASDFLYLFHYVAFHLGISVLKMYALFTLHETAWGTRKAADGSDPIVKVAIATTGRPNCLVAAPSSTNSLINAQSTETD